MTTRIIYDMPIREYHNGDAKTIGSTRLSQFLQNGPAWWRLRYIDKSIPHQEPSEAMRQGSMLDAAMTDPEAWKRYVAKPEGLSFASKEGKAWKAEHEGHEIVPEQWFAIVDDMTKAIGSHKSAAEFMSDPRMKCQVSLINKLPNGLTLQSRPDFLMLDEATKRGWYIDLKKTDDLAGFGRKAIDYGYHRQGAIAQWLAAAAGYRIDFYLLAVEWQRGARARMFQVGDHILDAGWREAKDTIDEIAQRFADDDWTDDHDGSVDGLEVPEWMMRKMEAQP